MSTVNFSVSATLIYALAAAVLLPYLPFIAVAVARLNQGYDARSPRSMFDKLPPYAQRATWAHQNGFEAAILFSAASLAAYVTGVDTVWAQYAAIAFVTARFLYPFAYIFDLPVVRSAMFAIANLSCFTLLGFSIARLNSAL